MILPVSDHNKITATELKKKTTCFSGENMEETPRGATEEGSQTSTDSLFTLSPPQSAGPSM